MDRKNALTKDIASNCEDSQYNPYSEATLPKKPRKTTKLAWWELEKFSCYHYVDSD